MVLALVAFLVAAAILADFAVTEDQDVTPNDKFFTISISEPPVIDPESWTLTVDGLVDTPMVLNYSQMTSLSNVTEKAELRCVTGPSGTAYYTGVSMPDFMHLVGVQDVASEMVFYCADSDGQESYSTSLTIQELNRSDILLAWGMNNVTLPVNQGFPLKLVVPGDWGYKWAKWIVHITVIDSDYRGYWEERGWADNAQITPISDWATHAVLLSFAAFLGAISAVSGVRNSKNRELSSKVPFSIPKKYHRYISFGFYVILLLVFLFWVTVTFDNRGAVFYTFHGRMALITVIMALAGIITSMPLLAGHDRWRTIHFVTNVGGYMLLLITIAFGVILAFG